MIVCADLHLRWDAPRCRTESGAEWFEFQRSILQFIVNTANSKGCPVAIVGDIFHRPTEPFRRDKEPIALVNMFIEEMNKLRKSCYIMQGNHDRKHRDPESLKTSYGALEKSFNKGSKFRPISDIGSYVPYGTDTPVIPEGGSIFLFTHEMVFENQESMPPMADGITARSLLDKYPEPSMIICGDHHHGFVFKKGSRTVLNCGCTTIQTVDMKDYKPVIHYIDPYIEGKDVEVIELPTGNSLVDDSYIKKEHERDERLESLVSKLEDTGSITLDFEENVDIKIAISPLDNGTLDAIKELME